nr:hypothetical protein CFP56_37147 [Quercus suber]
MKKRIVSPEYWPGSSSHISVQVERLPVITTRTTCRRTRLAAPPTFHIRLRDPRNHCPSVSSSNLMNYLVHEDLNLTPSPLKKLQDPTLFKTLTTFSVWPRHARAMAFRSVTSQSFVRTGLRGE